MRVRSATSALHSGGYLEVPFAEIKPLPVGSWYHHQLLGLRVETEAGEPLGEIVDVLEKPANDVWVTRRDGDEHLIPATKDAVVNVDLDGCRVVVADWLLRAEDA